MSEEDFNEIDILESVVIRCKDVSISISGSPEGILAGKTSDQVVLYCADILRKAIGENSLQESIEIPKALRETLQVNYNWSDIDFNQFIALWRKNLYLMRVGEDNGSTVDLEEYNKFLLYLEKKRKQESGELEAGDSSESALEEFAIEAEAVANIMNTEANTTPRVHIQGQELKVIATEKDIAKKVEGKRKTK